MMREVVMTATVRCRTKEGSAAIGRTKGTSVRPNSRGRARKIINVLMTVRQLSGPASRFCYEYGMVHHIVH